MGRYSWLGQIVSLWHWGDMRATEAWVVSWKSGRIARTNSGRASLTEAAAWGSSWTGQEGRECAYRSIRNPWADAECPADKGMERLVLFLYFLIFVWIAVCQSVTLGVYSFEVANSGCFPYYYLGLNFISFSYSTFLYALFSFQHLFHSWVDT